MEKNEVKIQPAKIFELLGIKNKEEANKVFSATLSFLVYMKKGDKLETNFGTFSKIGDDILHLESDIENVNIVDELEKRNILITLPV